jgi:hypothetical protein
MKKKALESIKSTLLIVIIVIIISLVAILANFFYDQYDLGVSITFTVSMAILIAALAITHFEL